MMIWRRPAKSVLLGFLVASGGTRLRGCRGLAAAAVTPAPHKQHLSYRLRRLVELVPDNDNDVVPALADIGCDHGLVARAICAERPGIGHVFAVDKSDAALKAAQADLALSSSSFSSIAAATRQPQFVLGDGLQPLQGLGLDYQVHTVICAGMGCSSVISILNPVSLKALGVQRLVLQPWPSYLLPLSSLFDHVTRAGFTFERQHVDFENGVHYVTTSFVARLDLGEQEGGGSGSEVATFMKSPLYLRYAAAAASSAVQEKQVWSDYLSTQLADLEVRLRQSSAPSRSRSRTGRGTGRETVVEDYRDVLRALLGQQ